MLRDNKVSILLSPKVYPGLIELRILGSVADVSRWNGGQDDNVREVFDGLKQSFGRRSNAGIL